MIFLSAALWTQSQLDQLMPKLLEAKKSNEARAQKDAAPESV